MDYIFIPLADSSETANENLKRIRARKRQDERWMLENRIESCIIDYDPVLDAQIRRGTRLDKTRILRTDEDNLY